MVRPIVAAGIVVASAMVAIAAMPTRPPHARSTSQPAVALPVKGAGTLKGQVRDLRGSPLAGAVVEASQEATGWRALALADAGGTFVIERVPAGAVTLVVRRGAIEFREDVVMPSAASRTIVVRPDAPPVEEQFGVAVGGWAGQAALPVAPSSERAGVARDAAVTGVLPRPHPWPHALPPTSMDAYARIDPSGYRRVADAPLSTFSIDVDTASYSNARRFLMEGDLPPADAVRVEEWVNYFRYRYQAPGGDDAFRVSTALGECPWNPSHRLLRIGVRGRASADAAPPARNLVFLVDVSGSMRPRDRLPLVKNALRMLADQITGRDRIALVVYAGRTGVVLPSTPGDRKAHIHDALQRLEAGGSTNGAGGIQLAYATAHEGFIEGGVNRVVLATDGDFNVGITSLGDLTRLIEEQRRKGVFLSVLGVGRGNLKDATLEQLADRGNGNYSYIDSLQEARRVLVEQADATLVTIARDVKLQVEFNPRHVGAYRLVGYENRALQTGDFADDARDAGEIGAGHVVTALYEIVPPSEAGTLPAATTLRYRHDRAPQAGHEDEIATVSVRHKLPDGDRSVAETHVVPRQATTADADTAFASAVAEAALVLRNDPIATGVSLQNAIRRAEANLGADPGGWRAEFVRLMQLAQAIQGLKDAATSEP